MNDFNHHLSELSQLLIKTKSLWQVVAFDHHDLPWQASFPNLAKCVEKLSQDEIETLDANQAQLVQLLLPEIIKDLALTSNDTQQVLALLNPEQLAKAFTPHDALSQFNANDIKHIQVGIKGRKWQQICAFTQAAFTPEQNQHLPVLEWCAGKGHLGRLVAKTQHRQVTSLEWQQSLCEQGKALSNKANINQEFVCQDAFAGIDLADISSPIKAQQHAIALHACGDLHVRLLTLGAMAQTQAISISPCCYHLIQASHYQALSNTAKQVDLNLSRHDLQLPLQHSVIASVKHNALRLKEVAWRLGFDELQRELTKNTNYLPVPTIKQSQLSGSFSDFCYWAAAQKGLDLVKLSGQKTIEFDVYLAKGKQRQLTTGRIDLVRHLFRQVLEQWLLLDRVCFLQEQGYQVQLSYFCKAQITPRNALIHAVKAI